MICSLNPLANVQHQLNALLNGNILPSMGHDYPLMNAYESAENITLTAELPGTSKEDINIHYENGIITLSGKRRVREMTGDCTPLQKERPEGTFDKSIRIPVKINDAAISATLKDGILTIVLPKSEDARPKLITIN